MTSGRRRLALAALVLHSALKEAMLLDLKHREGDELRGSRAFWRPFADVCLIGPVVYFAAAPRQGLDRQGGQPQGAEAYAATPRVSADCFIRE